MDICLSTQCMGVVFDCGMGNGKWEMGNGRGGDGIATLSDTHLHRYLLSCVRTERQIGRDSF